MRILPKSGYNSESFSVAMTTTAPVAARWVIVDFQMRALAEMDRSSQVGMEVVLRVKNLETGEFERIFARPATVSQQWERLRFAVELDRPYPSGTLQVLIRPLYFSPVTEIADLKILSYPEKPSLAAGKVYPGQEADAAWRVQAGQQIEQHRRGPLRIRLLDPSGEPVSGANIRIEQQRHSYPFGTAVVAQRIVDGPQHLYDADISESDHDARNAENAVYREKLQSLFNYVVYENDLKWPLWIQQDGHRRQEWTLESLQWLRARDYLIKGHTLIWGSWKRTPDSLRQYESDPEALQSRILEHIADIGGATRDWVDQWDVLNEPLSHRDLIEILGMERVAEWFKKAREVMPEVELIINDFDIIGNNGSPWQQERFYAFVKDLLDRGAPIDGIGFQSHFWSTRLTPPDTIWATIDRFADLGLSLYVTEFDMNFPDEAVQAAYTRDFLTAWFSHPKTNGFIMWGFWAGSHWFGESGAMYRKNWEPKPNAAAYLDLVFGDWWTDTAHVTTEDGTADFHPFFGEHRITVKAGGEAIALRYIRHSPTSPGELLIVIRE
jgi:GH35 family endo-1,4-beta-xylanase